MAPAACGHSGPQAPSDWGFDIPQGVPRPDCCQVPQAVIKERTECEEGVCLPPKGPGSQHRPFVSLPLVRTQSQGHIQLQGRLENVVLHTKADGRMDVCRQECGQASLFLQSQERLKLLSHSGPKHSLSGLKCSASLPLLPSA